MQAVILAGGKGTRLRPVTFLNPKPMLPLINRPFMLKFVTWLKSHGLSDIIFSTCYLPDVFTEYFGDGAKFGLKLTYVKEGDPLGTCGAVKNVEDHLEGNAFMVFNGDILTSLDLSAMAAFHKKKKADITIALTPVEDPTAYGLVPVDDDFRVKEFLEKPSPQEIITNLINAGTYMIEPHIMGLAPDGKKYSFERGLFPAALKKGLRIYGYVSDSYWLDVGTPEKYLMAHHDILEKKIPFEFPYKEIADDIYTGEGSRSARSNFYSGPVVIGENTVLEKGAKILPLTVIGNDCRISSGSKISGSIIFNKVKIGKNCIIKNSIISNNVELDKDVTIEDMSVIGDNTRIEKNNILKSGIKININSNVTEGQISF